MIGRDRDAQCCPRFSGQRQIAMKTIPPLLGFAAKTPAFFLKVSFFSVRVLAYANFGNFGGHDIPIASTTLPKIVMEDLYILCMYIYICL